MHRHRQRYTYGDRDTAIRIRDTSSAKCEESKLISIEVDKLNGQLRRK